MSELKAFDVGLGQYCEDGTPCVIAFDADRNPRLLNEQVYLKSEADKVIEKLERDIVKFKSSLKYLVVSGILDGPVKKAAEDLLKEE